jgi:hypothetical protein
MPFVIVLTPGRVSGAKRKLKKGEQYNGKDYWN